MTQIKNCKDKAASFLGVFLLQKIKKQHKTNKNCSSYKKYDKKRMLININNKKLTIELEQ